MIDSLAFDFVRHALLAGLLASILCGVVGTFVVVKRLVFISGGLSHAAFGGLGVCFFLGLEPLLGAAAVAVVSALILAAGGGERLRSHDALIGLLWAVGMAVGAVFVHKTPGYAPDLMTYLFGNILTVSLRDVVLTAGLVAVVLALVALFFKEFVAISFDEEFARVQGAPVRRALALMMVVVALTVVLLIQMVGIILVIALLTIPPMISLQLARSFPGVIGVSMLLGATMTVGGLALSYRYDLPSGPAIVLLGAALLFGVAGVRRLRQRSRRAAVAGAQRAA